MTMTTALNMTTMATTTPSPLEGYAAFLLAEITKDARVLDNPWVYCTVFPFALYLVYMGFKWYMLLAPVTIPLTVFFGFRQPSIAWLWKSRNN